jgi:hypothetical protein
MSKIFRGQPPEPHSKGIEGRKGKGGVGREGRGRERGRRRQGRKGDWMEWEGGSIPPNKILPLHYWRRLSVNSLVAVVLPLLRPTLSSDACLGMWATDCGRTQVPGFLVHLVFVHPLPACSAKGGLLL